MKNQLDISVIIPVYNNASTLSSLIRQLTSALADITPDYEIIFVNDGSTDESLEIINFGCLTYREVKAINLSRNFGQHPAISAALAHSTGRYTVLMDADLQDRPEDIKKLIDILQREEVDIIYTAKMMKFSKGRRLSSDLFHYVFSKCSGSAVPRNIGTFRAFNNVVLLALLSFSERNVVYGPLMFFMGFRWKCIELENNPRAPSRSSYTFTKRLKLAVDSLVTYTNMPSRMVLYTGIFTLFSAAMYGFLVLTEYLFYGSAMPSGTTLIIFLLCINLGCSMFMLGIIGSYVFRVYQEVLCRPRYIIQNKINLN